MTTFEIVAFSRQMLLSALFYMTPFLMAALIAGLLTGIVQAGTRMTDLTLSFVPRFVMVLAVVYLASSWMSQRMMDDLRHSTRAMVTVLE